MQKKCLLRACYYDGGIDHPIVKKENCSRFSALERKRKGYVCESHLETWACDVPLLLEETPVQFCWGAGGTIRDMGSFMC